MASTDPVDQVSALGALWSSDSDDYAAGSLNAARLRCALCLRTPCRCPEFGTPEYLALIDERHGRTH